MCAETWDQSVPTLAQLNAQKKNQDTRWSIWSTFP